MTATTTEGTPETRQQKRKRTREKKKPHDLPPVLEAEPATSDTTEEDEALEVADEAQLFDEPLPFANLTITKPSGKKVKLLLQALTVTMLDEINHVQDTPVRDAKGNIVEEATRVGWDAKVVARALCHPNKKRMAPVHWLSLADRIASTWVVAHTRDARAEVLRISGFGGGARAQAKKDS